MKLGAERKKIWILGGLLAVGGYFFYTNVLSDSGEGPVKQPGAVAAHGNAVSSILSPEPVARGPVVRPKSTAKASEEFRPTLKRKQEDAINPMDIDPTLRLDLLAKVQSVPLDSTGRNPFQFGAAPPPPAPVVKIDPKALAEAKLHPPAPPAPPKPAGPPPTPPLNLPWKFYGYTSPHGVAQKRCFVLIPSADGDEPLIATEGDVLKRKYRIVRIGVNSVVVEDIDTKSQQTLPLLEEAMG